MASLGDSMVGGAFSLAVAGAPRFELNAETEAQLLALYPNDAAQRERLKRRIARAKRNTEELQELVRRRDMLLHKNAMLEETANAAATAETAEYTASTTVVPILAAFDGDSAEAPPTAGGDSQVEAEGTPLPPMSTLKAAASTAVAVREDRSHGTHAYQYSGPRGVEGIVSPVLPDGQLYRIVTAANQWAFYNDTRNYEMHVRYLLDARSEIITHDNNTTRQEAEHPTVTATRSVVKLPGGQWDVSVVVPPEETAVLFEGVVCGFEAKCKAVLLTSDDMAVSEETDRRLCSDAWAAWEGVIQAAAEEKKDDPCAYPSIGPLAASTTGATAVQAAERVLQLCMQEKLPFVDPSFFPSHARLFRRHVDAYAIPPLHWRPPAAYLPPSSRGEEALFVGPVTPSNMMGGPLLPDHNVLSVVSAVLRLSPRAVYALFTHPEAVTALLDVKHSRRKSIGAHAVVEMERMLGAVRVQLCLSGWWHSLLVDSHVPAAQHRPEFARCPDDLRALWLPLLEKAYAKAFGSYAAILEASVPDVVANLTGCVCCSLAPVWPAFSAGAHKHSGAEAAKAEAARVQALSAFTKLVKQHVRQAHRGGSLALRTFPLTLAKSQGKRDQLEEIYATLGLAPGSTLLVLAVEELSSGHTLVRMRQNAPAAKGQEGCAQFWRQVGKEWVDELWELEITREAEAPSEEVDSDASTSKGGMLWMDLADVPQFFQEGFLLYGMKTDANGERDTGCREVRAKGVFTGLEGAPAVCMRLEVTASTHVTLCVTQTEQRLIRTERRLQEVYGQINSATRKRVSTSTSLSMMDTTNAAMDVRGLALQVLNRQGDSVVLVHNSSSPDIYASSTELQFAFQREAAVGLQLVPEKGPYYIIPRVSPPTDSRCAGVDVPYVLSLMSSGASIGRPDGTGDANSPSVSVSFVSLSPTATLLRQGKVTLGATTAVHAMSDLKETAAEYQLCHQVGDQRLFVHHKGIDVT